MTQQGADSASPNAEYVLDADDQEFYSEAFVLADAVRRFLARMSTQRVIDAGLLDDDVVTPLVESADRMWLIRTHRVGNARAKAAHNDGSGGGEHHIDGSGSRISGGVVSGGSGT